MGDVKGKDPCDAKSDNLEEAEGADLGKRQGQVPMLTSRAKIRSNVEGKDSGKYQ